MASIELFAIHVWFRYQTLAYEKVILRLTLQSNVVERPNEQSKNKKHLFLRLHYNLFIEKLNQTFLNPKRKKDHQLNRIASYHIHLKVQQCTFSFGFFLFLIIIIIYNSTELGAGHSSSIFFYVYFFPRQLLRERKICIKNSNEMISVAHEIIYNEKSFRYFQSLDGWQLT